MREDQKIPWKDRPWVQFNYTDGMDDAEKFELWRDECNLSAYGACCEFFQQPAKPKVLTWRDVVDFSEVPAISLGFAESKTRDLFKRYFYHNEGVYETLPGTITRTNWTAADIDAGRAIVTEDE